MKIETAATFMKNVTRFADTNHDGKLDSKEVDALRKSLNKTENAAIAAAVRLVSGRTSLVGVKVDEFEGAVGRVATQAHCVDAAGNNSGFISIPEAKAARLDQDVKSALIAFARLADSRGEPIKWHGRE